VASLKTAEALRRHLASSGIALDFDDVLARVGTSPLASSLTVHNVRIGNRFCILPMEGWDGTLDGEPSELTMRRWKHFGQSGAKLIWGGEAVAICDEARANPNQLVIEDRTKPALARLRETLISEHTTRFGPNAADDLYIGLQLTHSGRFSRPRKGAAEPRVAYAHPQLDRRFADGVHVLSDEELEAIAEMFVTAARLAHDVGFQFIDFKHCHGYLMHELLGAKARAGKYGGSFENRTRLMMHIIDAIRSDVPGLEIAVRLSVFDMVPHKQGPLGRGEPEAPSQGYAHGLGVLENERMDEALGESLRIIEMLRERGVRLICVTAGSPYYCPHAQRPAAFPPIDGYEPPEDPLRGVARQIDATARLKRAFPDLVFVGSAYSYLQEWLPNVGQYNVRNDMTDFVGLGRMALSYPDLPADVLSGAPLKRKMICRTFSDCTTGPRLGLVSGCFPLDPFYVGHPDAVRLKEIKAGTRSAKPRALSDSDGQID
jgi:2,4-dienoyl-CoA reductase-like NADH-dependent reductase (Old Yellow Enzyme family)